MSESERERERSRIFMDRLRKTIQTLSKGSRPFTSVVVPAKRKRLMQPPLCVGS
jgi:hypothetical protein